MKKAAYRSNRCLNCHHPLDVSDKYCSNCGQKNSIKRLTLYSFFDEFLSNFYAYDSKFRRSIALMFAKPGMLAREFVEGKRQKYANPFRFYLSVSLVFFIFTSMLTKWDKKELMKDTQLESGQTIQTSFDSIRKKEGALVDFEMDAKPQKDSIRKYSEQELKSYSFFKRAILKSQTFTDFQEQYPHKSTTEALKELGYELTTWNVYLYKKTRDSQQIFNSSGSGTDAFLNYLIEKLPFILFLSLPILTLCFKLVYFRHDITYAEHMAFLYSFMTFVFLIMLIQEIVEVCFNFTFEGIAALGISFYFYKSLRFFYHQERWKTIIKFVILNGLLMISTAVLTLVVLGVVFLMY